MSKLPLPTRYDLDLNPVSRAEPSAASYEAIRSLYAQWMEDRPDTIRLHASVWYVLQRTMPVASFPAAPEQQVFGLRLVIDPELAPGEWKLLAGSEEIDAGTVPVDI
jgi:hypothetical protein